MLIDWFTVVAQAINFLILVWLMKRFMYGPILDAINAREQRIATDLADAAARQAEALREREKFHRKNQELEQSRNEFLRQASEEAEKLRQRLLAEAGQAVDALSQKRQQSLQTEARNLNQTLLLRTQQEVFSIARKTLTDLADAQLEERIVNAFLEQLGNLDGQVRDRLSQAVADLKEPVVIRTVFELPDAARKAIRLAVSELTAADVRVRFDTLPEIIGGIELTAAGQKLAWSIADYLTSLEFGVGEVLQSNAKPARAPNGLSESIGAVEATV